MPYRELPTDEPCVILTMAPSTYWIRLRAMCRALRPLAAWLVGLANFLFTGGWLWFSSESQTPERELFRLTVTGYVAVVATLLVLLPLAMVALVRSLERPAAEGWLPRRMVFLEETILVTDKEGRESDEGWSTVQEARLAPTEIQLVLSREPLQLLYVHRRAIGEAPFDLLAQWLKTKTKTT